VEEEKRPPVTKFDWRKRRQIAVSLARRLPEILTPMGTLAIEGYGGEEDWLPPDDLVPILDMLNPGQAHLFSCTEDLVRNPDIRELVDRRKLILHKEKLAVLMAKGPRLIE
jgi:hypothetical protein